MRQAVQRPFVIGGVLAQPTFNENPLVDKEGESPSFVGSLLFIKPPPLFTPSPPSVIRHEAFNSGVQIGGGRGLFIGLLAGIGAVLVAQKFMGRRR